MKKTYKDFWDEYYIDICRLYIFHIGLIKFKLGNKLKLNRYEKELLSLLYEYDHIINDMERIDVNGKEKL